MIQVVYDGTSDVIVISQIRSRRSTSLLLTRSCLLSKHVLGMYAFTNVSKHVFKIRMCLLRTQRHGCQIYKLRFQLGLDLWITQSVRRYSNVHCMMSDYQGDTSSNIKETWYTAARYVRSLCLCLVEFSCAQVSCETGNLRTWENYCGMHLVQYIVYTNP